MTEKEFEKTIHRYSRLLWFIAARVLNGVGNEQDVEECVADVFIDLWQTPQSYDPSRGSLKSWLCIKCRSKSIDRFRKLTAHMTEGLDEKQITVTPDLAEKLFIKNYAQKLKDAINSLREPEREIMIRRFFLEQKPQQIAKIMKLPIRKVENIIYRTKEKLREEQRGSYEEME